MEVSDLCKRLQDVYAIAQTRAIEGGKIDVELGIDGDPEATTLCHLHARVGSHTRFVRIRTISPWGHDPDVIEAKELSDEAVLEMLGAVRGWLLDLPTPEEQMRADLIRSIERARELSELLGLDPDPLADILRAAVAMTGNLLPKK
jgi:hypothetical protein